MFQTIETTVLRVECDISVQQDVGTDRPAILTLDVLEGPCKGTTYFKTGNFFTVGRTRASKVHIKDPAVSEKHAELSWEDGYWTVRDVGSSNGTAVNSKKLEEGLSAVCHASVRIIYVKAKGLQSSPCHLSLSKSSVE
jgi:pSer/pThr/pTyr-binding forkhead associated (FHA) protein